MKDKRMALGLEDMNYSILKHIVSVNVIVVTFGAVSSAKARSPGPDAETNEF